MPHNRSIQFTISGDSNKLLLEFVASELSISKKRAKSLLDQRAVLVNSRRVWMAKHQLKPGDRVEITIQDHELDIPDKEISVLYEDQQCLVVDKPAGVLTDNAQNCLEERLRKQLNDKMILAVHRLDRDTSGAILFAKGPREREQLQDLFRKRDLDKTYRALVIGKFPASLRRIDKPIDGKDAITLIRVLATNDTASYLELKLLTGRTHQIRKHLAGEGHAIIGDKEYLNKVPDNQTLRHASRQMLHAVSLEFNSPADKLIRCEAKIPDDFRSILMTLRLK